MHATKRIPVTEEMWQELSRLKKAGQTYSELLKEIVEEHRKTHQFKEMRLIEERGDFVELD